MTACSDNDDTTPFTICPGEEAWSWDAAAGDTLRVLAIGNSFSEDALEDELMPVCKSLGINMIVGNLYRGGCTLKDHVKYASAGTAAYEYRKMTPDAGLTSTPDVTMAHVLTDEPWDVITFQEASENSGKHDTYDAHLQQLVAYVLGRVTNPGPTLGIHQTWAYAHTATNTAFADYGYDQATMYESIVDASQYALALIGGRVYVPCGTAVQNARSTWLGDSFNRDGTHIQGTYGHYALALTWLETLTGIPATDVTYRPETVDDNVAATIRDAVHAAVTNPFSVTELPAWAMTCDYTRGIYVDFGSDYTQSFAPWNNVISYNDSSVLHLADNEGRPRAATLAVTKPFANVDAAAPTATSCDLLPMDEATCGDSFRGDSATGTSQLTIGSLDPQKEYKFLMFSSTTSVSYCRQTQFTVIGATTDSACITPALNVSELACITMLPAADGTVTIDISAGPGNTHPDGHYYLNAMAIIY